MATATTSVVSSEEPGKNWSPFSAEYNAVEGMTVPLVQEVVYEVNQLSPLDVPDVIAFDNGCGTGAVTTTLKTAFPNLQLISTDISEGMIDLVLAKVKEKGWKNVEARVLDAAKLNGIADSRITHAFSTFMVCLAPEPYQILNEMYRVTKPGGILGFATWADPYFGFWTTPWTKACRELDPQYEPPYMMEPAWTLLDSVRVRLQDAGFQEVNLHHATSMWKWGSVQEAVNWFFEAGHPRCVATALSWTERGREIGEIKLGFTRALAEVYEQKDGKMAGPCIACIGTARK